MVVSRFVKIRFRELLRCSPIGRDSVKARVGEDDDVVGSPARPHSKRRARDRDSGAKDCKQGRPIL